MRYATNNVETKRGNTYDPEFRSKPNPPIITGIFVSGLAHPDFLVEMDAIAVVPL